MRHVTTPKEASRKGRASTSAATKRTPEAPRSWMNRRAAWSMGSVTSVATTLGVKPAKPRAVWPPPVAMSSTRSAPRARPQARRWSRSAPPAWPWLVISLPPLFRTATGRAPCAPRSCLGRARGALGEMAEEKVRVHGGEIEAAPRLVDETHAVGIRMLVQLLLEPAHRLLDS